MTYEGMEVADGTEAGLAWESLIRGGLDQDERNRIRKALLDYCGQDTLAMVRLVEVLRSIPADAHQLTYNRGDYVKVEFPDETTGIGEWMWMTVDHCDDEKRLVYGVLDNKPVNDYERKIELGSELAVSYSQVREHRKSGEFGPH
jgi:hypothetical protein